eukprot:6672752-Pyramimonas_sp.AAC.2
MFPRRRAHGSSAHPKSWKSAARRATPRTAFGSSRSSCQGGALEGSAGCWVEFAAEQLMARGFE